MASLVTDRVQEFDGERPYLATGDVGDQADFHPTPVTYTERPSRADITVLPGDVCFARMAATRKILEFTADHRNVILSTGFAVLRPHGGEVYPGYLRNWLNTNQFQASKNGLASGATQKAITNEKIALLTIPLPDTIEDQIRIAEVLDKADALRTKRRAALARLDTLSQSVFLEMFGDPATNPKGWPTEELQSVVREGTIVTYGIVQAGEEFPGGVPYIRTGDIVNGEIVVGGLRLTDPELASRFRRSRVETGDIVMSIRATVGTTAVVPASLDGANLTQGTARIAPGPRASGQYLLNYLRAPGTQRWIERQIKGATFREITLARLRELPVRVPPMSLQTQFAARVTVVERLKASQISSSVALDALVGALQHRAFIDGFG